MLINFLGDNCTQSFKRGSFSKPIWVHNFWICHWLLDVFSRLRLCCGTNCHLFCATLLGYYVKVRITWCTVQLCIVYKATLLYSCVCSDKLYMLILQHHRASFLVLSYFLFVVLCRANTHMSRWLWSTLFATTCAALSVIWTELLL